MFCLIAFGIENKSFLTQQDNASVIYTYIYIYIVKETSSNDRDNLRLTLSDGRIDFVSRILSEVFGSASRAC